MIIQCITSITQWSGKCFDLFFLWFYFAHNTHRPFRWPIHVFLKLYSGGKSPCCNPINSVYSIKHTHFIMLNEWQHALSSLEMIYFNLLVINPLWIRDESPINPCNFSINEEKVMKKWQIQVKPSRKWCHFLGVHLNLSEIRYKTTDYQVYTPTPQVLHLFKGCS